MFLKFMLRRFLYVIPMLFITTLVVFSLILLIPGDPVLATLGENATYEKVAELRQQLGLDQPVIMQYIHWLTNAVHGDLGRSLFTGQQVGHAIRQHLAITIQLVAVGMTFAIAGGMFFAITSIYFPKSWLDYTARFLGTLGTAIPNFLCAMILIIIFSLNLNWLPAIGFISITDGAGYLKTYIPTSKGEIKPVDDVAFAIAKGEIVALVGESGSGKSVSSLSIMRLNAGAIKYRPDSSILFAGRDLLKLKEKELRKIRGNDIAMIFHPPDYS